MSKFATLTKKQKQFVLVAQKTGKLGPGNTITLKEVQRVYNEAKKKRASGGTKVGFPIWIINDKFKVERGVYKLPVPTSEELAEFNEELTLLTKQAAKKKVPGKRGRPKGSKNKNAKPKEVAKLSVDVDTTEIEQDKASINKVLTTLADDFTDPETQPEGNEPWLANSDALARIKKNLNIKGE